MKLIQVCTFICGVSTLGAQAFGACASRLPLNTGALPPLSGRVVFQRSDRALTNSALYTFDFSAASSAPVQISLAWSVTVPLNPVFSPNGKYIAFTAITSCSGSLKTRDAFIWQIGTPSPVDVTPNCSGNKRGEDPKWSPDGQSIVTKITNFVTGNVNITILSLQFDANGVPSVANATSVPNAAGTVSTSTEPSAPSFSADARYVFFGRGVCKYGNYSACSNAAIHQILLLNGNDATYSTNGHYAYYPVVRDLTTVFYAGWTADAPNDSTANPDQVFIQAPLISNAAMVNGFNECSSNNSDPASVDSDHIFFSSTSTLLPPGGSAYWPVVANVAGLPAGASVWDLSRSGMLAGIPSGFDILGMNYTTAR